jgi:outer membrane protein OmpA-like peptidoglycan-associated protein
MRIFSKEIRAFDDWHRPCCMPRQRRLRMGTRTFAIAALFVFGCASTAPPGELTRAHIAYERAAQGPAAQVAPDELHKAQLALDEANRLYDKDPDGQVTRDMAYIAERKAELAEARAEIIIAERQRANADQAYKTTLEQQNAAAKGQLEAQKTATLRAQEDAAAAAAEASRAQADAAAQAQARQDAEARADAAMRDLATVAATREEQRGLVITLSGDLLFQTDQAVLLSSASMRLDKLATALEETNQNLVIEGHTDSRGSDSHNQDLSYRRAAAVRDYLISRGVTPSRLSIEGYGKSRPIADNTSPEGRAMNRRVEIVVVGFNTAHR